MKSPDHLPTLDQRRTARICRRGLVATVALVLLWRVPIIMREPGGQDEDWFAVPGWTILRDGIPRVPYAPYRLKGSAFYKADQALFALPPCYYYFTAPYYIFLPATFSTARLASLTAGVAGVLLVNAIGLRALRDPPAALCAAVLYSVSRAFFFPATTARPDMLCGMWGLAAVWAMWRWSDSRRRSDLIGAGICCGLGMLTHPFALVYCLQAGVWCLATKGAWRERIGRSMLLIGCALAAFGLWLPLISAYPEVFRAQFFANVLDRSGPGLITRLFIPWPYVDQQLKLLVEHAGPIQTLLMAIGVIGAVWQIRRSRDRRAGLLVALTVSAVYLLIACQGPHATKGYWCYPAALLFLCVGWFVCGLFRRLWIQGFAGRGVAIGVIVLSSALMLPGSGLRTWFAHLRHWSDPNYSAPHFVRRLLADLPPEARYTVDPAFVFDFQAAGRSTILAVTHEFYFDARPFAYDYLIVSRYGLDENAGAVLNGRLVRSYGDRNDRFACYAEVYVPADQGAAGDEAGENQRGPNERSEP